METKEPYNVKASAEKEKRAKMKIRNGVRLLLQGIEELWQLPRSFETKREQEEKR